MVWLRRLGVVALLAATFDVRAGSQPKAQVTIWHAAADAGGSTYGSVGSATAGAMIFEHREVDVAANGEVRLSNIASTADPASMQLRDLTDKSATITEQRFVPAAKTPTEMIARRIGEQITIVTPKGDVTGVLRGVDERAIVLEVGTGEARRVSVMRRDYALDVRMSGPAHDRPSAIWKLSPAKPGKHEIELSYRADGLAWSADYLAVLDEPGKLVDFSAWATIKNATGATFDNADVTLLGGGIASVSTVLGGTGSSTFTRPTPGPSRFVVPRPVKLTGESMQLELFPPRVAAKAKTVVGYEAMADPSSEAQETPGVDCSNNNGTGSGGGTAELLLEVDVPSALPEGKVRLFRKKGTRLEVIAEEALRIGAGFARVKLSLEPYVTGERRALSCAVDERTHTIHEKIEVKVENKGTQPAEVVIREYLWRWPVWRVEGESVKGARAGAQTQEYRVRIGAKSSQTVSYTAVYTW